MDLWIESGGFIFAGLEDIDGAGNLFLGELKDDICLPAVPFVIRKKNSVRSAIQSDVELRGYGT